MSEAEESGSATRQEYQEALAALRQDAPGARDRLEELGKGTSPEAAKARMALAQAELDAGAFEAAEARYRAEAEALLSAGRKAEVAEIYFELAAAAARPPKDKLDAQGDHSKALRLLGYLCEQDLPPELEARARIESGRVALAGKSWHQAEQAFRSYLERFDTCYGVEVKGELPGARVQRHEGSACVEARLGLVEAALRGVSGYPGEGDPLEPPSASGVADGVVSLLENTLRHLEDGDFPARVETSPADLERALFLRPLVAGLGRRFQSEGDGATGPAAARRAVEYAGDYWKRYPGTARGVALMPWAPAALLTAGFPDAAMARIRELLDMKPPEDPEAARRFATLADAGHFALGGIEAACGRWDVAVEALQAYLAEHPDGAMWKSAQEAIERCLAADGLRALQGGDGDRARELWEQVRAKQGLADTAGWLALAGALTWAEEGRQAGEAEKPRVRKDRYEKAAEALAAVARRYPGEVSDVAREHRGRILETELGDLPGGVEEYRASGTYGANNALERLEEVELQLTSPRTYRSDETPKVELRVRNLDKVTFKRYPLNLADFFRKYRSADGVDRLDLDLVSPDETWEEAIPEYARFQRFEVPVAIRAGDPGAYAITVEGGEYESTVLVLVSDLEVVTASTRSEAVVLVQDMRQGEAAAGVELQVWGGPRPGQILELETGADGVARDRFGEAPSEELRVLATRGEQVMVTGLPLPGSGVRRLAPRGYLETSRPVYQPGETVRLRGVIRTVSEGRFAIPEGRSYLVTLSAPDGTLLGERPARPDACGSFEARFRLPARAPFGEYTLRVSPRAKDGRSVPAQEVFSRQVLVERVEPSKVELTLETSAPAVRAGDPLGLSLKAAYYTGAPLAGRALELTLPDGRVRRLETDAAGEASLELDTTPFFRSSHLQLVAEVPGERARVERQVPLLPAAIDLALKAPGRAVQGERWAATLTATTPAGDPIAEAALTVRVSRPGTGGAVGLPSDVLQRAGISQGEAPPFQAAAEAEELSLVTDAEGHATISLELDRAGPWRVVAVARDAEGRERLLAHRLRVEAPSSPKLALEADATRLKVGEEGAVRARYQDRPGLGLLLWLGDGLLDYRVHAFERGVRALRFPVEAGYLPNFQLVALAPGERQLQEARQDFEVRRALAVELVMPPQPWRPGAELEVEVLTRDEHGEPAPASVSFGLVDLGLLDQYPDPLPPIREHFEAGARRQVDLSAGASVVFRQVGERREVAKEILEEAARMEREMLDSLDKQRMLDGVMAEAPMMQMAFCESAEEECLDDAFMDLEGASFGGGGPGGPMPPPAPSPAPMKKGRARRRSMAKPAKMDMPCEPEPAVPEARRELPTDGVWVGQVQTGDDGSGTVRFAVPDRTGAYRVMARGAGRGDLFGEAKARATIRREVWAELVLPDFLTEGDEVRPLVEVHDAGAGGAVEVAVELSVGHRQRRFTHALAVPANHMTRAVSGPFGVPAGRRLKARVTVTRGEDTLDVLEREIPVRPWGVPVAAAAAGVVTDLAACELELPSGSDPASARLVITLHAPETLEVSASPCFPCVPLLGLAGTALDVLATLARADARSGVADDGELARDQAAAADGLATLATSQRSDGSLPWLAGAAPEELTSDAESTGWALMAFDEARRMGWYPEARPAERAASYLSEAGLDYEEDHELPALLALARRGGADFSVLNRLHRARGSASPYRKAMLGLAFLATDRHEQAGELAADLEELADDAPLAARAAAFVLLARLERPGQPERRAALLASAATRVGWGSDGSLTRLALAAAPPASATGPSEVEVTVKVAGKEVGVYRERGPLPARRFLLEGADLEPGPVPISLALKGRGAVAYRAELEAFRPQIEEVHELRDNGICNEVRYHSPRLYKGRHLLDSSMKVERVAFDDHVQRKLGFTSSRSQGRYPGRYQILTQWIPAGLRVDRTSLPDRALRVVEDRGRITMVFAGRPSDHRLRLLPRCPGTYVAPSGELACARDPSALDRYADEHRITVLAPEEADETPYAWSQGEHRYFGLAHFRDGEIEAALEHLGKLPEKTRNGNREVLRAMLDIRCRPEHYEPREVVDLFEVLEQRYPDETVGYRTLLAVGRAYHDSGEDEAACLLWRSTLEAAFRDEVPVAAELEDAGEYPRATDHLEALYWRYPDLPLVAETFYGLAQDLYAHKSDAEAFPGVSTPRVVRRVIGLLGEFLRYFPDSPYLEPASFSLLGAYRELGAHARARDEAIRAARRWPEGDFADRFRYVEALAAFDLGEYEDAVRAAEEVAATRARDSRTATLLLGQMHQALGRAEEARKAYREVEDYFPDAAQSIRYLERQGLRLPEVVTTSPGEPVSVEVSYVGAAELEVLAYRVDLMRLFLKERNLDRVAGVDLAGITPTCTFRRELPASPPGTTGTAEISLPFEEEGAYLVLARAGEAFASGLALVTGLHLEVLPLSDGVRVTVLEGADRSPARDVFVRVSDGSGFQAGETDLRGTVTLPARAGRATVVARRGADEYAFHRADPARAAGPVSGSVNEGRVAYDAAIMQDNLDLQQVASQTLRSNFVRRKAKERGVKAAKVRK